MKRSQSGSAISRFKVSASDILQAASAIPAPEAISLFKSWIKFNPSSPQLGLVLFQLGAYQAQLGEVQEAMASMRRVIALLPNFGMARRNLALLLEKAGDVNGAVEQTSLLIEKVDQGKITKDELLPALNQLARLYESQGRWPEASIPLHRSFALDTSQNDVLYHLIRMRQRLCDWPIYSGLKNVDLKRVLENTSAMAMLSITDDPAEQLAAARRNAKKYATEGIPRLSPEKGYQHEKIRIGYASSNFGMHAVSFLTAELYEAHDRNQFEVYGFCWSPKHDNPLRTRVISAFDHYFPIHDLTDEAAARLIAEHEIDVLIDLQGLTTGARPGIFSWRAAPMQVSYLGHPGTCCVPGVDYLIADRELVPEGYEQFYGETILFMPHCFQVNDSKRSRGVTGLTRAHFGIPEDQFVFCAHNNTNKITPEMFSLWMEILRQSENTILWCIADNETAEENLRAQVAASGVDANRVVFSGQAPYEVYLARLSLGDLMLDTFPFNGGTTTSDALWMGLPVLTLRGRSFASRMSSSILLSLGLVDLVAESTERYLEKALNLRKTLTDLEELKVATLSKDSLRRQYFDSMVQCSSLLQISYRELFQNTADR